MCDHNWNERDRSQISILHSTLNCSRYLSIRYYKVDINHCELNIVAVGDYVPISDMEVVFLPTESMKCVDITVLNDGLFEDPEMFIVTITPTDSNLLSVFRSQASITIISEDSEFKLE